MNGTNLLGLRYFDAQYLYGSTFDRGASFAPSRSNVLVANPTMIMITLEVHIDGRKEHTHNTQNNDDE